MAVDISTEPGGLSSEGLSTLEKILRTQARGGNRRKGETREERDGETHGSERVEVMITGVRIKESCMKGFNYH